MSTHGFSAKLRSIHKKDKIPLTEFSPTMRIDISIAAIIIYDEERTQSIHKQR